MIVPALHVSCRSCGFFLVFFILNVFFFFLRKILQHYAKLSMCQDLNVKSSHMIPYFYFAHKLLL